MRSIEIQDTWYVLNQNRKQGPYTYAQMIEFVQKSEILDYQYVWAPHLSEWTVLAEVDDFSKDRMIRLIEKAEKLPFYQRTVPRVALKLEIFAHNFHKAFDGTCYSLSENGGYFLLNEPLLQTGHKLQVHFPTQSGNSTAFNVNCEVKVKKFSKTRLNSKSGLHYVLLFSPEQSAKSTLKNLIELHLSSGSAKEVV